MTEGGPARFLGWVENNPGRTIAYATVLLVFAIALPVAWAEGWIGAPAFRTGCAAVTRTGACP